MTTFRAAYVGDCVLTGPEHAHLDDEALLAEAVAEAHRAGLIGDDAHQIAPTDIVIGEWTGAGSRPARPAAPGVRGPGARQTAPMDRGQKRTQP